MDLETPYYLIDERKLLKNLKIIKKIRDCSGAKSLLALKCFSTWSVFGLMKKYMDGTTSSSTYEARLGYEKFGKETHAYCVGYSKEDIKEVSKFCDKIIFNSISQLKMFYPYAKNCEIGLRINPKVSYSHFDLANPNRKFSRLGVTDKKSLSKTLSLISGVMFHFNCENNDFRNFSLNLDYISREYGDLLKRLEWVSLGGGIYFTKEGYPLEKFCKKLKEFSKRFGVQVYLEPGESAITESTELVTKVLDIVHNKIDIAIVDASTEAHMLDLLIYRINAKIKDKGNGRYKYMIAGRSCLAGDVFGTYNLKSKLKIGSIVKFSDAGGYTMVKKNWFNGLKMPSIAVKRLNGKIDLVHRFNYKDFINSLS
ncbi:MAG: carboxynorspermidine decarboxylase [Candidatus Omnitrophica bacterium]|nr:carboxynorspermidine decarboxylase [Candidatus Omnitrophota bacterium]MDD5352088.1 carboxynorspermidine decarboxylase [Candidatus Omnitrophota bacterium]MDD5549686.1 carboxynorspermidine decarboxylase [Candidatus Omnitrophota bacterium]